VAIVDKTTLVTEVAELLRIADHSVQTSVQINHREIDVVAVERSGLSRKTILVECADYATPVGVEKLETDLGKLRAATREKGSTAVAMHVSRSGYSPQAAGLAGAEGLEALTLAELTSRLVNFDAYVATAEADPARAVIVSEYQPTRVHYEHERAAKGRPAPDFLRGWLKDGSTWLTVLGDYGVGKSWMLKRLQFSLLEDYKNQPTTAPLPFFVPLQAFTKAFDFQTLVVATLQRNGVLSVNYEAVRYLANEGRLVYLFDSFDEMAQLLRRTTVRENLRELLNGISGGSRAIMTSRPTCFESRAERLRLVEDNGELLWEEVDAAENEQHTAVVNFISSRLEASQYARLNDLTSPQRLALFATVLKDRPAALAKLKELFNKFQNLEGLAQRAVIARLLTSVGEALADADVDTVLSASSAEFNEASVFGLVVQTLLKRDLGIGDLSAAYRHLFLQAFAVHLQQSGQDSFASPNEVRTLVAELFAARIRSSDTPKAVEEEFYRTCRRHSGLTTERQYLDTTGNIDTPIDDTDKDARVGFSHNSLREYLVAEAAVDHLKGKAKFSGVKTARLTDAIADFVVGLAEHETALVDVLSKAWGQRATSGDDWLFHLVYGFMRRDVSVGHALLGRPPDLSGLDLSGYDLGSLDLRGANFDGAIAFDADFQQSDLRDVEFGDAILELVRFDGARLDNARFATTDVVSVYVHDAFNTRTTSVLSGQDAQQWLFSRGAIVRHPES